MRVLPMTSYTDKETISLQRALVSRLLPASMHIAAQDPNTSARVVEYDAGHYKIHYHCATASALRVANAYFDGWAANAGSGRRQVFPSNTHYWAWWRPRARAISRSTIARKNLELALRLAQLVLCSATAYF
jgi:hypothetical protein